METEGCFHPRQAPSQEQGKGAPSLAACASLPANPMASWQQLLPMLCSLQVQQRPQGLVSCGSTPVAPCHPPARFAVPVEEGPWVLRLLPQRLQDGAENVSGRRYSCHPGPGTNHSICFGVRVSKRPQQPLLTFRFTETCCLTD